MIAQAPETNHARQAAARQEVRAHDPARVLVVALDIGKDVNVVYARQADQRERLAPTKVSSHTVGWQQVQDWLRGWLTGGAYDMVLVGHEPTGISHENWSAALSTLLAPHTAGERPPLVRYRHLAPLLVKQERARTSVRLRKSDDLDARAMAVLLEQGLGQAVVALPPAEADLRLALGHLRRLAAQQRRLKHELLRLMDRLWPGALGQSSRYEALHPDMPPLRHLVESHPLERERVRVILEHLPNPYDLRRLGPAGIADRFRAHGARCGAASAALIHAVATTSLLPPEALCQTLAAQVQQTFGLYRAIEAAIQTQETLALARLPQTSGQVATTLPGVSPLLAARYLAGIGAVSRFPSAGHIWAFAGLDPTLHQSGNYRTRARLTHRGSPYLRSTLFQLGHLAAQHCPDTIRLMARLRDRGMPLIPATLHVANKVNRILFQLLTTQQPYVSPLTPEEDQRWHKYARQRRAR